MKKFWKDFLLRGMVAAWSGPVVLCIVWACLNAAGVVETLDMTNVVSGVLSATLVAFIAGGITALHQMEQLPRGMAILIHMAVLYLDYLVIYLLNDWLKVEAIWVFTVIFVAGFALIWAIIFLVNRKAVNRMNMRISEEESVDGRYAGT